MAEKNQKGIKRAAEGASQPAAKISLAFIAQDGSEVYYRYIKDKKMQYLFMEYCKEKNLYYQSVVFLYDGRRVASNRTPLELGLEDGDTIDVMIHQQGGYR